MSFDALKYVENLRKAGVPDRQAEAQVRILNETIDSNLATKRDMKEMEQKLTRDMKEMEQKLTRDIKEMEQKLTRDIKEMEQKLTRDMKEMEQRIVIKLGSLLTAGLVALVALSKLNLI